MVTSTMVGTASATTLFATVRRCTGRLRIVRSSGAGTICTVTVAGRGFFRRSAWSRTPTVTLSLTFSRAPATETGSVIASLARLTALSGPTTSTVAGSALSSPTTYPGAGRPSTAGTTGTRRDADPSNWIAIADGITC